jgi:outer membrane autotransporter protein
MAASLLTSAVVMAAVATQPAHAQSATWSTAPVAGDNFNNAANWVPATVPGSETNTGTASFGTTTADGDSPLIMSNTTLTAFQFLSGAPSYSIGVIGPNTLTFVNGGVTQNLSGNDQVIVVTSGGTLAFDNSTAGDNTIGYSNRGGAIEFNNGSTAGTAGFENQSGGTINFINSSAGSSVITNNFLTGTVTFQGTSSAGSATISNDTTTGGGSIIFTDTSNAGTATIQNFATGNTITFQGTSNASSATIENSSGDTLNFTTNSTAGTSTITNDGTAIFTDSATAGQANIANNAILNFMGTSTGGTATITTNSGGTTSFFDSSTGGVARFITNSGGVFDISTLTAAGMTAGSIEGAGNYFLGSKELTTGLNNLSTTVSGVISDGGAGGGTGGSLIKVGTGVLTLTNANTYIGPTTITEGVINLTGSLLSPVSVGPAGTLGSTGTVFNTVTNAGTVQPGFGLPTGTFGTLTVNNYVGLGGSTLALNTFLGADNSPSDQLTINGGTATGSSSIFVTNVGGPGAQTTANGILVVNAVNGATTAPGSFTLDNPELRAGAFDYDLVRGGLNGTDPNDWFLRSSIVVEPTPTPPPPPPPPPFPDEPPPTTLPPGFFPIIGPELATYGVVQPLARQLGLTTLGTLDERTGGTAANACCCVDTTTPSTAIVVKTPAITDFGCRPSVWGRVFGEQIRDHYEAFADPRADGSLFGVQSGVDLWRGSIVPIVGHRDVTGIYLAYGNTAVDVNGLVTNAAATNYVLTKTGTVRFDGWSGGAYWTHYGPTDWYVDAVVQGTFYQGNAATQFANLPLTGNGFASSLEAGYPFPLPWFGPRFALEPQAQIVWQRVSFYDANDGLGSVGLGDTSGASGRIGLRGQWTIVSGEPLQPQTLQRTPQLWWPQVWQPYVRADLWRDWGADAATAFGSDLVPLISQATRIDLAAGVTARISVNLSVYAQGGYQFAIDDTAGGQRDGIKGDLGLRYTW